MITMRIKAPILLGILGIQSIFSSPYPNFEPCVNTPRVKGPVGPCTKALTSRNAWRPTCLNSRRPYGHHTRPKPSSFGQSSKDMETLSDRDVWGNSGRNGTMSLSGMPPEFFAALATDSQNSITPVNSYHGMAGGMDLFGIRSMFVSPSANSIVSHFGATDLHRFSSR